MYVKWIQVDDVRYECEKEFMRSKSKFRSQPIDGCSIWHQSFFGNTCTIMTPKRVNYWTFGHELRHCFQGSFHKW